VHYTLEAREAAKELLDGRNPYEGRAKKKSLSPVRPRIKKDTPLLPKQEELGFWARLKSCLVIILQILFTPDWYIFSVFVILFFLVCLHAIIMYLIETFAS